MTDLVDRKNYDLILSRWESGVKPCNPNVHRNFLTPDVPPILSPATVLMLEK